MISNSTEGNDFLKISLRKLKDGAQNQYAYDILT